MNIVDMFIWSGSGKFDYINRLIRLSVIKLSDGHCIKHWPNEVNAREGMIIVNNGAPDRKVDGLREHPTNRAEKVEDWFSLISNEACE